MNATLLKPLFASIRLNKAVRFDLGGAGLPIENKSQNPDG
jgi:hypothetical protein